MEAICFIFACFCVSIGSCTCGAGYTGEFCESKCEQGYFGKNCGQVCQCEESHHFGCDPITGRCICKPEWRGINIIFNKLYYILYKIALINYC